jgi:hypothetical protein
MLDAVGRESPQTLGDFPVAAIVQALGHDKQRVVWCAVMALADGRDIELRNLPASGLQVLNEGVLLLPGHHLVVGVGHDQDPRRSIAHGIEWLIHPAA